MTNLTVLDLDDNQISDIAPLSGLVNLTELDLDGNQVSDIAPLQNLTKLTVLDLRANAIVDVSPLAGLVNLTVLDLSSNHISDFSPLAGLLENLVEYNNSNQTLLDYKQADVNRDGVVDIGDLLVVFRNFGIGGLGGSCAPEHLSGCEW